MAINGATSLYVIWITSGDENSTSILGSFFSNTEIGHLITKSLKSNDLFSELYGMYYLFN